MKKYLLLSLLIIGFNCSLAWAQSRKISGTVTAEEGVGGFAGATVVVKGTTIGTVIHDKRTHFWSYSCVFSRRYANHRRSNRRPKSD